MHGGPHAAAAQQLARWEIHYIDLPRVHALSTGVGGRIVPMADRISRHAPKALVDFALRHAQVQAFVCTRQQHEHGYTMTPRVIHDYNLLFVTRGRPVWVVDGHRIELKPQDLLLVNPGEPHHAECRTKRVTITSLHVMVFLPGGQDVLALLRMKRVQSVRRGSRLDGYLRGACSEYDRDDLPATQQMMNGWADLIVRELLAHNAACGNIDVRDIDPLITQVLDELTRYVDRPLTLNRLAEWSGYSAQHLNRTFRQALGVTPLQYLLRMRMQRATELLQQDRLTVAAVGQQVGMDDPYYFSRVFKQYAGVSPTEYRRLACSDSPS